MHGAGYCCLRPSAILLLSVGIMQLYQPVAAARYHLSITRDSEPSRLMSITQNTTADGFLQKLSKLGSPCNNSTIPTAANASHGTAKALKTESEGLLSYDLDKLPNLQALLQAHRVAQNAALRDPVGHPPNAIKVVTHDNVGLGNRVPSIVTGFVLALFTRRAFLLESSILQHVQLPLYAEWSSYAAGYQHTSKCNINNITRLLDANSSLCGEGPASVLMLYHSIDYDMPFLQVNPAHQPQFIKYFPDGEVFHSIATYLFHNTTPVVQRTMQPYSAQAQGCLVGLHLRTKKHAASTGLQPPQFAGIAKALAQSQAGNIFVAADRADVFAAMKELLPSKDVWWTDLTYRSVNTSKTAGGNPGTEISAIVDLLLLGRCQHIVVTPGSSFGAVAAGLAGVKPVYATYGAHDHPFLNTWFWQSVTSEPCCFKLSRNHYLDSRLTSTVRQVHPLYYFHNQCHH